MNYDNYYAAIGRAVVAEQIVNNWTEGLRNQIVQWCIQNDVYLISVGACFLGITPTPNGPIVIVRVFGVLPDGQTIHLIDAQAPLFVGEAIGVVYQGYPVNEPRELFDEDDLNDDDWEDEDDDDWEEGDWEDEGA